MASLQEAALRAHRREGIARSCITLCGVGAALVPFCIGAFLILQGSSTFTQFQHGIGEFLFSTQWAPNDTAAGGGAVGAGIFIAGSIMTCILALLFSLPISMASAIFLSEIAPPWGRLLIRPAVELFVGIPSVVYGWIGLTVLVPLLRSLFHTQFGFSVLAASCVLAVMIFPTITSMAADALLAVPKDWRSASYALGATRWETIYRVVIPAARTGIFTGIVLGLARALGEALAVAMVIGQMKVMPTSLLSPASTLTTVIASDMGGAMEGGEYSAALWTMALILFLFSSLFIYLIHRIADASQLKEAS